MKPRKDRPMNTYLKDLQLEQERRLKEAIQITEPTTEGTMYSRIFKPQQRI